MALPKLFNLITWHNNTTPAINEDNLNAMSQAIDGIDDRVIGLAGTIMEDVPQIQEDIEELEEDFALIDEKIADATSEANRATTEANRATTKANEAAASVISAGNKALISEGYAKGTQNGTPVGSSSPYYHNNAEYFKEQARSFTPTGYQDLVDDVAEAQEAITDIEGEKVSSNDAYVLRQCKGNMVDLDLVGGSVAWNQLCNGSSVTVPNGHKYYMRKSGTTSIGASTGSAITGLTSGTDNVIDLTQLFGTTTIADYIYALEQATAGAGVAWFRQYFRNLYYAYNVGEIKSVNPSSRKVIGKNLITAIENGIWNTDTQQKTSSPSRARTANIIKVEPLKKYTFSIATESGYVTKVKVDSYNGLGSGTFISSSDWQDVPFTYTAPSNTLYVTIEYGFTVATYNPEKYTSNAQFEIGETATAYQPYNLIEYDFDPSKQLRGIPKLVDNKLSYDGDIYTADGTVTRKYGIFNLGDYTWVKETTSSGYRFYAIESTIKNTSGASVIPNAICSKYPTTTPELTWTASTTKGVSVNITNHVIYIADSDYSDAEALKTSLSGVYLVAELATPTTESANAYQNPQRAFIDGTEEFVDAGVTASTRDVSIPVGNMSEYNTSEVLPISQDYTDGAMEILKEIVASSSDFADFKTKVAAL